METRILDDRWSTPEGATLRALAWTGMAAQVLAVAALAALGRWPEWRMLTCFVAPTLLFMLLPHRMPPALVLLLVAMTGLSGAGWAWNWYRATGFDDLLHVLNPFAILLPLMVQLRRANATVRPGTRLFVLQAAAIALLLAVGWELVEMTFLRLSWVDTAFDVLLGVMGGALGGHAAARVIRREGIRPERGHERDPVP